MHVDKIQKKSLPSVRGVLGDTKQKLNFRDNRISQMKQNTTICQMQAWVGTRTLGTSGSSGSGSSGSSGSGIDKDAEQEKIDDEYTIVDGHRKRIDGNDPVPRDLSLKRTYKQLFNPNENGYRYNAIHAHLLFDEVHDFGDKLRSNNIGYGKGGLFADTYDYKTIGHVMPEEDQAVNAVNNVIDTGRYTADQYKLTGIKGKGHNCQHFVAEVFQEYKGLQDAEP